jgi:OOP family OmpA-OmpF porin
LYDNRGRPADYYACGGKGDDPTGVHVRECSLPPLPDVNPEPAPELQPEPAPDVSEPSPDVIGPIPDVPEPLPEFVEPVPDVIEASYDVAEVSSDVAEASSDVAEAWSDVAEASSDVADSNPEIVEPHADVPTPQDPGPDVPPADTDDVTNGEASPDGALPSDSGEIDFQETDATDETSDTDTDAVPDETQDRGRLQGGMTCAAGGIRGAPDVSGLLAISGGLLLLMLCLGSMRSGDRGGRGRRFRLPMGTAGILLVLVVLGILFLPSRTWAEDRVEDLSGRRYSLRSGSLGILGTDTGRTLAFLQYEAGLVLGYASRSIVETRDKKVVRTWLGPRFEGELWGAVGVFPRIDIGLSLPITWWQDGTRSDGSRASRTGIGDLSIVPRFTLMDEAKGAEATLGLVVEIVAPTGRRGTYMSLGTFQTVGKLAMSKSLSGITMGLDLWYRWVLRAVNAWNVKDADQLGASFALQYEFPWLPLQLAAEVNLAVPSTRPFFRKEEIASEALGGVAYRIGPWRVRVAGGGGIAPGFGVPRARFLASVDYTSPVPVKKKVETPATPQPVTQVQPEPVPVAVEPAVVKPEVTEPTPEAPPAAPEPPVPAAQPALPKTELPESVNLLFGAGEFRVSERYADVLDRVAQQVRQDNRIVGVMIEGHTSIPGSADHNLRLSGRRAESVRRALVDRGVPVRKVHTRGLGATMPVASGLTPEANAQNRRVQIVFQVGD